MMLLFVNQLIIKKRRVKKSERGFVKMIKAVIMNTVLNMEEGTGFKFKKGTMKLKIKLV